MTTKVIYVDKDGVLNEFNGWKGEYKEYPLKKGAKRFLTRLKKEGWYIVLYTASPIKSTREWVKKHKLPIDRITNKKGYAAIYLDDRAITYKGDYDKSLKQIRKFKEWWR